MTRKLSVPIRVIRLLYIMITIAIVLSIVSGVKITGGTDDTSTAYKLQKAAAIIYLVVFIVLCGLVILIMVNMRYVHESEKRLVLALIICLPIAFVRVLYTLISTFSNGSTTFNIFAPNIWTEAFMQVLEEMLTVTILIAAGLLTTSRKYQAQADFDAHHQQLHTGPLKASNH